MNQFKNIMSPFLRGATTHNLKLNELTSFHNEDTLPNEHRLNISGNKIDNE